MRSRKVVYHEEERIRVFRGCFDISGTLMNVELRETRHSKQHYLRFDALMCDCASPSSIEHHSVRKAAHRTGARSQEVRAPEQVCA